VSVETSLLQALVAVGKMLSFSRAAEELHVTQSAISQSIKNLETKLSMQLVQRAGKRIHLTTEGEKLFHVAQDVLNRLDDTIRELKEDKEGMSGKIRIGTFSGIAKSWLSSVLFEFSSEFPRCSVDIWHDEPNNLLSMFDAYRLDALIIPESIIPGGGKHEFLMEEKAVLVFPASEQFGISNASTLEDIVHLPLILVQENDSLFRRWCYAKFGSLPTNIHGRFTINSHAQILEAVSRGLGIAVVPSHVLNRSPFKDKVKTFDESFAIPTNKFHFVYHEESMDLTRMQKLREVIVHKASDFN